MTILIIILGIIALPFIIAIFTKKEYTITRTIVIDKPKREVFNYLTFQKNQDYYNKWVMRDPNMKKTFTGTDGSVGSIYAWDSKDKGAGAGEQELKKIQIGERIDYEIRFERPFKAITPAYFITEDAGENQTKVQWYFINQMNIVCLFINFEKVLGTDMGTSLINLKTILENPTNN